MTPEAITTLLYLAGLACFILSFRSLPRPETARRGDTLAAAGSVLFTALLALGAVV